MGMEAALIVPSLFSTALGLAGQAGALGSKKQSADGPDALARERQAEADERRRRREDREDARERARRNLARDETAHPLAVSEQGVTGEADVARPGLKNKLGE